MKSVNTHHESVTTFTHNEACSFFLKNESYSRLDMPHYINFTNLLTNINNYMKDKNLLSCANGAGDFTDVNYVIFDNKDGKYAWRPMEIINPLLYVSLVRYITEEGNWKIIISKLREFSENEKIICISLPLHSTSNRKDKAAQILNWWQEIEQRSIELSLQYEFIVKTDLTDCYSSIYTHSIAWALHTKEIAKEHRRDRKLLGNEIDNYLRLMHHNQTNGIPQGSVLMDFIAEILLGYADLELSRRIQTKRIEDYCILRYRDDYRIFINNPQDGDEILKILTEIMLDLGLKLNPSKTSMSADVIIDSIKSDKLNWTFRTQSNDDLQKHLLIIYDHAYKHANTGSIINALTEYNDLLTTHKLKSVKNNVLPLIAIVVDIAYKNPRTYPVCFAIVSKLIALISGLTEKEEIINKIKQKFSRIPNTGHMQIWLQRISYPLTKNIEFDEKICKLIDGHKVSLWNTDWISAKVLKQLMATNIIDKEALAVLNPVIPRKEIELFKRKWTWGNYSQ